ncbi:putative PepSY-like beta-lactamase-inhibitor [Aquimarina sp. MAR_2010_214]|uniref:PepSY-like domain-containing protein n=1 Tax=Aquimarina sp. MAR_2010_214 TaxID=1250026 RepID=UPI000C70E79C|nr:PepSY-like domain-containing protein [Aquimarina sp. MAR_2010_214]PKV50213.1 putative PepSY-like beta-lactamase-inhibitor [Aquimarina sp. MAR_2010_214]
MQTLKFLIPYLMLLTISCSSVAQKKVPTAVEKSFKEKYPDENDPDWHKDKNGYYESNFKIKGKHYRADFDSSGKWIETERNIKKKKLPNAVKEKIERDFDDYKIIEIEEVDHHLKGRFYDVEFKINGKKQDIEFNKNGKIIN